MEKRKVSYEVGQAEIMGTITNEWMVTYYYDGFIDHDVRGTDRMGCKFFPSKEKAIRSGERYLKKFADEHYEKQAYEAVITDITFEDGVTVKGHKYIRIK